MASGELQWLGLAEAARLIRQGDVSPVEIVEDTLSWIERTDPITRAFVTLLADDALREAKAAERALLSGDDRGPLHGLTYTVKDVIGVKGVPMKCNSKLAEDFVPVEDSHVVSRMRRAGAICIGKCATHELSWGVISSPSRNPWDGKSVTGGSSGGSGATVAAGQCAGSIGADCGCSVRNPAALNGVTGMRATHGRVATTGSVPLSMTLDTIGPLARSAQDSALMLNVMAGHDPADPTSSTAPVPDFTAKLGESVAGLKIGVPTNFFFDHIEDGVKRAVEDGIRTLEHLGMEVREIEMPHATYTHGAFLNIVCAESAALLDEFTPARAAELGIDVRTFVELGTLVLAKDYCKSQQIRSLVRQDFERAFVYAGVDIIVIPTTAATAKAPKDDPYLINVEYPDGYTEDVAWAYCRYNTPVSMAGCPTLVVPCGFGDDELPVGMQVVAPAFGEQTALQVGHAYQQATDWHTRRPTELMERSARQPRRPLKS